MKRIRLSRFLLAALCAVLCFAPLPVPAAGVSGDPGGHTNRGVKYAQKKEYAKAVEEFTKAIERQPQDPKNYRNRGLTYRLLGEKKKSEADYAKAIELNPDTSKARMDRARMLLRARKPDAALKELSAVIAAQPRDGAALRLRAYIYLEQGKWKQAIADYDVAINSIAEVDVEGRTRRGFAYRNLEQYDKALEDFDKVIAVEPKNVEAYRRRVYVYRAMKQNEKAIADLQTILKLKPKDEDAQAQLKALQKKK